MTELDAVKGCVSSVILVHTGEINGCSYQQQSMVFRDRLISKAAAVWLYCRKAIQRSRRRTKVQSAWWSTAADDHLVGVRASPVSPTSRRLPLKSAMDKHEEIQCPQKRSFILLQFRCLIYYFMQNILIKLIHKSFNHFFSSIFFIELKK